MYGYLVNSFLVDLVIFFIVAFSKVGSNGLLVHDRMDIDLMEVLIFFMNFV